MLDVLDLGRGSFVPSLSKLGGVEPQIGEGVLEFCFELGVVACKLAQDCFFVGAEPMDVCPHHRSPSAAKNTPFTDLGCSGDNGWVTLLQRLMRMK